MKIGSLPSTMLGLAVAGLALAAVIEPLTQEVLLMRTDQQAQARTAGDIDLVGQAMFSWLSDQVGVAAGGELKISGSSPVDITHYPAITHEGLTSLLVPVYLSEVPEMDGWNRPYEYYLNTANPLASNVMAIRSPARDGAVSGIVYSPGRFDPDSFDQDLVWADGYQVRWPRSRTDREKQNQTVTEIQRIGTAMFSWLTDQVGFADKKRDPGQEPVLGTTTVNLGSFPPITHGNLDALLVPQYMPYLPELDAWGNPYDFRLNTGNLLGADVMAIRSNGRDLSTEGNLYSVTAFDPDDYDQDIVWADGSFVRWPATGQGLSFFAVPPCRVLDTRSDSALQSGNTTLFEVGGACGVPTSAKAVALNVTAVGATGTGYVTLVPEGVPMPTVSTISFAAGQTRANNALLGVAGAVGSIQAKAFVNGNGQVHVILDVSGYFE